MLFSEGKSPRENNKRLDAVFDDLSPSMVTVKNWFDEFQRDRESRCTENGHYGG